MLGGRKHRHQQGREGKQTRQRPALDKADPRSRRQWRGDPVGGACRRAVPDFAVGDFPAGRQRGLSAELGLGADRGVIFQHGVRFHRRVALQENRAEESVRALDARILDVDEGADAHAVLDDQQLRAPMVTLSIMTSRPIRAPSARR